MLTNTKQSKDHKNAKAYVITIILVANINVWIELIDNLKGHDYYHIQSQFFFLLNDLWVCLKRCLEVRSGRMWSKIIITIIFIKKKNLLVCAGDIREKPKGDMYNRDMQIIPLQQK